MREDVVNRMKIMRKCQQEASLEVMRIVETEGEVLIILKDGKYFLEYTLAAVKEVYKQTGLNINTTDIPQEKYADLSFLAIMIHAGIQVRGNEAPLSLEDVEQLMLMKHMSYYAATVQLAISAAQPDTDRLTAIWAQLEDQQLPLALADTSSGSGVKPEVSAAPTLTFTE